MPSHPLFHLRERPCDPPCTCGGASTSPTCSTASRSAAQCSAAGHTSPPCPPPPELPLPACCRVPMAQLHRALASPGTHRPCLCQPQPAQVLLEDGPCPREGAGTPEAFCQPSLGICSCSAEPPRALSGWRRAELVNLQISGKASGERVQRKGCQVHIKVSSNCTTANPPLALLPLDGSVPCSPLLQSLACPAPRQGTGLGSPQGAGAAWPHHCWPLADGQWAETQGDDTALGWSTPAPGPAHSHWLSQAIFPAP